jgi:hypothetical protein
MQSVQVIADEREPSTVQIFVTGLEASVAALGGAVQATVWFPLDLARRLYNALGDKLDGGES